MQLQCRLVPRNDTIRTQLVARLVALGFEPHSDGSAVVLDYDGPCSGRPLSAITVFESFGCDRAIIFKDWKGDDEDGEPNTRIKVNLGH